MPDMGEPEADGKVEDLGKDGDPKEDVIELADKVTELSSDLKEAVMALTGEQAEMGGVGTPVGGPAMADDGASSKNANFSSSTLNTLRKELNCALIGAMKQSIAELNDNKQELDMIVSMHDKGAINNSNKDLVSAITDDTKTESKAAIADGLKLMTAFVKYARGTNAITKRAEIEAELRSFAEGDSTMSETKDSHSAGDSDLMSLISDTNSALEEVDDLVEPDTEKEFDLDEFLKDDEDRDFGSEHEVKEHMKDTGLEDLGLDDDNDVKMDVDLSKLPPDAMKPAMASFASKAGRAAMRAKLAADALGKQETGEIQDMSKQKWSDMLEQADKLTDGQTQLDTKPSGTLGLVETLPEMNKRFMEVAKMQPKVRKEAEAIQKLVSEGKLDPKDVDALVAEGLDKDAVSYWKKYYGEVDGGSEFASELVKEHVKASMETELNTFKVKLARAYELAYDMADRDLCRNDRASVTAQVDEIMKFNDDSFESLKRVVARHAPSMKKEASRLPQVGLRGNDSLSAVVEEGEFSQLANMFGNKKSNF